MDLSTMLILAVIGGVIAAIVGVSVASGNRKAINDLILNTKNFSVDSQYVSPDGTTGIAIDEGRAKVCLVRKAGEKFKSRVVAHRDILSSEIHENGQTVTKSVRSSQIGRAVVGGLLAGGVGAVIGGLSGNKIDKSKITQLDLRLVVNDPSEPVHDVRFLTMESAKDSILYKTAAEDARQWQARMDVLIKRAERDAEKSNKSKFARVAGVADELQKLAALKASGVLSEEEFRVQKAKLLR